MKPDSLVGTRVREYEILEIIGKGGMGAVYRARHVLLDEDRAIKVILAGFERDESFVERFIHEAKILSRLRHPNLVQMFEFGTLEENIFFMVLEFLKGESVQKRMERTGKIPVRDAVRIACEAARGLHCAHEQAIVHRDISPDNLFLVQGPAGVEITKVLDFGIARPVAGRGAGNIKTGTSIFIGKPEYCSPEQCGILEEGQMIDGRSDQYSLAITFYQMVTGKLPFYSPTPPGYFVKHASEPPMPPTSIDANLPNLVDSIILKSLAKNRNDRYPSLLDFAADLSRLEETVSPPNFSDTSPLQSGSVFAKRYLVEKKLGEGGMGTVWKATDRMLNVLVALKIMAPDLVSQPAPLERLKREVVLARSIGHKNVCRIYDISEWQGVHYISMEYIEGKTLSEMFNSRQLFPVAKTVALTKQALQGLAEIHRAGIVHRDLKPQNIMLDGAGCLRIMDFGISISGEARRVTDSVAMIGTPYYMSPEQTRSPNVDHRSDLYSMGVILFQLLTGKLPFWEKSPMAVALAHLQKDPPRPSEIVPTSPELDRIVLKALEKPPERRYQCAEDFLKDLEALETGHDSDVETVGLPSAPAEPLPGDSASSAESKPRLSPVRLTPPRAHVKLVVAALSVLLVLGLGIALKFLNKPEPQKLPSAPVVSSVTVIMNARPWARITVKSEENREIQQNTGTTPCAFRLPYGKYKVELTSDSQPQPVVKTVSIEPGGERSFIFDMPSFDAEKALAQIKRNTRK